MALGGVLHALTPMSGGMSITTVNAAFADLTKGGMAINLHQTANPAIYTACGDIPMIAPAGGTAEGAAATSPVSPVVGLQAEVKNYVLPTLNVNVGTTVTWAQRDLEGHTVTAPGLFDSGILDEGKTFSYTFTKAGTYTYTCTLHPSMTGTITVGEPSMAPIDTGY
ncbi:MAG: cupredoxin domain-containing protein [Chloroflexi bacterium]|nr:cupredoxin domain-containing protein [Chloroflexota bacterium]